jgi:hypothetical protein
VVVGGGVEVVAGDVICGGSGCEGGAGGGV